MVLAIYRALEDGSYVLVAAFNEEELPDSDPSDWPAEICDWFAQNGETCLIIRHSLLNLPLKMSGDVMREGI